MTYPVDWLPVRDYVRRQLAALSSNLWTPGAEPDRSTIAPIAGTPEWQALDDNDPTKLAAVLAAGSRWALEVELDRIHQRAAAEKDAALEISQAVDWTAISKQITDRDRFYRDHPDLRRKAA